MSLTVYTVEHSAQWDAAVRSFENYDVYYLSGYAKAFRLHGDGEPLLFFYQGDGVRGINAVMRRDAALDPGLAGALPPGEYFDLATPYGYGGWLIEGDGDTAPLFAAYRRCCADMGVISEFTRFHPVLGNAGRCQGGCALTLLGDTVAMDLSSPEVIWDNLTSKNRNMLRKARRSGVEVFHGREESLYEEFMGVYNATMDRDAAAGYYYFPPAFYKSLHDDLPDNACVFYAMAEGRLVAASVILCCNGRLNYHLSGSLAEYRSLAPTNLLLYEAALWGCERGCASFHLGGGIGAQADSLLAFKRGFYRGEAKKYYRGESVFLPAEYERLVKMRTQPVRPGYFPAYRG